MYIQSAGWAQPFASDTIPRMRVSTLSALAVPSFLITNWPYSVSCNPARRIASAIRCLKQIKFSSQIMAYRLSATIRSSGNPWTLKNCFPESPFGTAVEASVGAMNRLGSLQVCQTNKAPLYSSTWTLTVSLSLSNLCCLSSSDFIFAACFSLSCSFF